MFNNYPSIVSYQYFISQEAYLKGIPQMIYYCTIIKSMGIIKVLTRIPDSGVQLMAEGLAIIQLCKQWEEDLHASDGVYATLD